MARFAWQSITQVVPTGLARVQFFNGNESRVALIISSDNASVVRIGWLGGLTYDAVWFALQLANPVPLTYRDYGPPIKAEVFLSHTSVGNANITATEIYRLPGC